MDKISEALRSLCCLIKSGLLCALWVIFCVGTCTSNTILGNPQVPKLDSSKLQSNSKRDIWATVIPSLKNIVRTREDKWPEIPIAKRPSVPSTFVDIEEIVITSNENAPDLIMSKDPDSAFEFPGGNINLQTDIDEISNTPLNVIQLNHNNEDRLPNSQQSNGGLLVKSITVNRKKRNVLDQGIKENETHAQDGFALDMENSREQRIMGFYNYLRWLIDGLEEATLNKFYSLESINENQDNAYGMRSDDEINNVKDDAISNESQNQDYSERNDVGPYRRLQMFPLDPEVLKQIFGGIDDKKSKRSIMPSLSDIRNALHEIVKFLWDQFIHNVLLVLFPPLGILLQAIDIIKVIFNVFKFLFQPVISIFKGLSRLMTP